MAITINDIKCVIEKYPELSYRKDKKGYILEGKLVINHEFNNEHIHKVFDINISIPEDYPKYIPSVKEIGGNIRLTYPHVFKSGELCLSTYIEQEIFLKEHTLAEWIENFVVPYFFTYEYYTKYGEYPFGERSHGKKGMLESYRDLFNIHDENIDIYSILKYATKKKVYRGHDKCPCGSGNKLRDCHLELIKEIMESDFYDLIVKDFITISKSK